MKKTIIFVSYLLCFAIIVTLVVFTGNANTKIQQKTEAIDGYVVSNLKNYAGILASDDKLAEYTPAQIEKYKVDTAKYIYMASTLYTQSSYQEYKNVYELLGIFHFISQSDTLLSVSFTADEIDAILYIANHMQEKDNVEAKAETLLPRFRTFQ